MTSATSIEAVQRLLGYRFRQPRLLEEALTHKSYSNERRTKDRTQNERLEFLGDAVLSLVMSEYLAAEFPGSNEGGLSKLKAHLVSEASLAKAARRMKLGRLLRLGKGEELSKGREKHSLLADALEALIAAVYLDGGLEASRTFTLRVLEEELLAARAERARPGMDDYKTQLQELCQKRFESLPQYATVRESGPDHEKVFEVELTIQGVMRGVGCGHSKKEAEQMAAREALTQLTT
ncbi:MAG: Ribonuclease 3 [Nitrospira sp.]|nr:ribonuclease III [Nitrospira sp.]ULA61246.1 MAG: Ribonuclease 3 [Nitrospira sp.]